MKRLLLLLAIVCGLVLAGCGSNAVEPDPTVNKKPLPPGTKTKDVLLPINK